MSAAVWLRKPHLTMQAGSSEGVPPLLPPLQQSGGSVPPAPAAAPGGGGASASVGSGASGSGGGGGGGGGGVAGGIKTGGGGGGGGAAPAGGGDQALGMLAEKLQGSGGVGHNAATSPQADSNASVSASAGLAVEPIIRYEARGAPHLPFEVKDEVWWAFLVRYRNVQLSLASLLFWIACVVTHSLMSRYTWHRGVVQFKMVGTPPLHDLLHEWLPNTQPYRVIPEIGHALPVLYLSGLMLYHFDQRSLDCFRTFLVAHGFLIIVRGLSFIGTLLPDSSQQCHVSLFVGSCHDLIFSGHVMIMVLCTLLAQHYFNVPPIIRACIAINDTVVAIFVVSSRNHYTVDVVLAVFATLFVFIAFTRHPLLVSLCVETPVNVLSKTCLMDPYQRDGMCACRRQRTVRATREGYEVLSDAEGVKRMYEHAYASLRLLGLKPSIVLKKVSSPTHGSPALEGESEVLLPSPSRAPAAPHLTHARRRHHGSGAHGHSGGHALPAAQAPPSDARLDPAAVQASPWASDVREWNAPAGKQHAAVPLPPHSARSARRASETASAMVAGGSDMYPSVNILRSMREVEAPPRRTHAQVSSHPQQQQQQQQQQVPLPHSSRSVGGSGTGSPFRHASAASSTWAAARHRSGSGTASSTTDAAGTGEATLLGLDSGSAAGVGSGVADMWSPTLPLLRERKVSSTSDGTGHSGQSEVSPDEADTMPHVHRRGGATADAGGPLVPGFSGDMRGGRASRDADASEPSDGDVDDARSSSPLGAGDSAVQHTLHVQQLLAPPPAYHAPYVATGGAALPSGMAAPRRSGAPRYMHQVASPDARWPSADDTHIAMSVHAQPQAAYGSGHRVSMHAAARPASSSISGAMLGDDMSAAAAAARRTRANSSMGVAEYEAMLSARMDGRRSVSSGHPAGVPAMFSPVHTRYDRQPLSPALVQSAQGQGQGQQVGVPMPMPWLYDADSPTDEMDGYELDAALLAALPDSEHITNREHLQAGIADAYQRLHASARALWGVNHMSSFMRQAGHFVRTALDGRAAWEAQVAAAAAAAAASSSSATTAAASSAMSPPPAATATSGTGGISVGTATASTHARTASPSADSSSGHGLLTQMGVSSPHGGGPVGSSGSNAANDAAGGTGSSPSGLPQPPSATSTSVTGAASSATASARRRRGGA